MNNGNQRPEVDPPAWTQQAWLHWLRGLVAILCLSSTVGCRETEPQRFPISGTITLDDQPLGRVLITLVPTSPGQVGCTVEAAHGQFDASSADGATAGSYHVVVSALEPDLEEFDARRSTGEKKLFGSVMLPAKYQKPGSLSVEIVAGRDNELTIELSSR